MILQRYILRELLGSFVFAFLSLMAVCLIVTMFQVFRSFPGLGFEVLIQMLPLATGVMVSWVLLVASCTSSTLVYARLSAENEITAMKTCGIHIWRILSPAVLLGLLLVGMAYPLNEYVVPWTRYHRRLSFRETAIYALRKPQPGIQDIRIGALRITYTDYRDGRMENPTISQYNGENLVMEYFATSGTIHVGDGPIRFVMTKPRYWKLDEKTGQQVRLSAENDVPIELKPEDSERLPRGNSDLPQEELWRMLFASKDPAVRNSILLILHSRYAASLAPLLLVLVAVPIGILVRRGSRLAGLGAALPPLLIYFIAFFIFQGLGAKNKVPALVAAYTPDLFLAVLSAILLKTVSQK